MVSKKDIVIIIVEIFSCTDTVHKFKFLIAGKTGTNKGAIESLIFSILILRPGKSAANSPKY